MVANIKLGQTLFTVFKYVVVLTVSYTFPMQTNHSWFGCPPEIKTSFDTFLVTGFVWSGL